MDEMTKKFNELVEEIKSMFTVSQAMAKNSFDSTLQIPVEGETDNPDPLPGHEYPQQPTAGEFTKDFREQIGRQAVGIGSLGEIRRMAKEACDRLDRAEAINKELLIECRQAFNESHNPKVEKILKAAIAKAKKEAEVIEKKHGGCWPEAKKEG